MPGVRWCLALTLQLSLFVACSAMERPSEKLPTNSNSRGTNNDTMKIINGTEVAPDKFPWMVQLYENMTWFKCGGTIITKRHVLTAAHCSWEVPAYSISIVAGAYYLFPQEIGLTKRYKVESKVEHEKYFSSNLTWYDIAILQTVDPIKFNEVVGPVCLPTKPLDMTDQRVRTIGWGQTDWDQPISVTLQEVILEVVDISICKSKYLGITHSPTQLCLRTPQKGICKGDTGGPGMWHDPRTELYIQVGVNSFFGKNCSTDYPLVQTDVSHFIPWIQKNIAPAGENLITCANITRL